MAASLRTAFRPAAPVSSILTATTLLVEGLPPDNGVIVADSIVLVVDRVAYGFAPPPPPLHALKPTAADATSAATDARLGRRAVAVTRRTVGNVYRER